MEPLKIGIAGLGRLGKIHAENLVKRIPNAILTAACSILQHELDFVSEHLGIKQLYTDYDEMIRRADMDAVAIITTSGMHCAHLTAALEAGKHVFCEKPLGVTIEECKHAEKVVEAHPNQVFFLGFMRRFDASYQYAMEKVKSGAIGQPYLVKAVGIDPLKYIEGALKFAPTSGGIYIDMAIHDIDLMRWFLNDDPDTVYALGSSYGYPEFASFGDAETGCALYHFKNGGMGTIHTGRMAAHGYHIETEIVGTKGSIRISPVPQKNLAVLYNEHGVVTECVESFPERFEAAYLKEMQVFVDCVLQGTKPGISVYDGTRCTQIAFATTQSYKEGKLVNIQY
jgi:myo-inositol 2-dehydrogenase/D-chiro-inositol 1-dehydrogenase